MPAYDQTQSPPAPVATVHVSDPVTGARARGLPGKLDTGADVTVLPEALLRELGSAPRGHIWVRSFDGSYSRRPVYYVQMTVEGFDVPMVRCTGADRKGLLLGRNVLNRFVLTLDGKNLVFEITDH